MRLVVVPYLTPENYNVARPGTRTLSVVVPYLTPENYNNVARTMTSSSVVVPYLTPENYNLCALTPCFTGGFSPFSAKKVSILEE